MPFASTRIDGSRLRHMKSATSSHCKVAAFSTAAFSILKYSRSCSQRRPFSSVKTQATTELSPLFPTANAGSHQQEALTIRSRGLAYWEIEVTGPNRDLHSGHFGGAVANPINVLCKLMADITDVDGRITIPGFYDDVEDVSPAEREMIAQIPFDEEKYKKAIGVDALFGEKGYSTLERNSCRPSFDICGIWGGYTGEGSKTVLPSKAYAKVSTRLVPHQDHAKISQMFEEYIARVTPPYVKVKVTPSHGGQGYVCPIDLPAYQAAEKAVGIAFGKKPLAVRRGGSIPIISTFEQVLGIKTVLMGFGLEQNAIHSPNESQELDIFFKGIESVAEFYRLYK